jgi:hypothetical protein
LLAVLGEIGDQFAFDRIIHRRIVKSSWLRSIPSPILAGSADEGRLPVLVLNNGFSAHGSLPTHPLPQAPGLGFGRQPPDQRAAGNFDDEILARDAVHAFAHAASPFWAMRRGT